MVYAIASIAVLGFVVWSLLGLILYGTSPQAALLTQSTSSGQRDMVPTRLGGLATSLLLYGLHPPSCSMVGTSPHCRIDYDPGYGS